MRKLRKLRLCHSLILLVGIHVFGGCANYQNNAPTQVKQPRALFISARDDGVLLLGEKQIALGDLRTDLNRSLEDGEWDEIHLYTGKKLQKLTTDTIAIVRDLSLKHCIAVKEFHATGSSYGIEH